MNSIGIIIKKEVRTYLNSPIAYIAAIFFLLICGIWFFFIQQFLAMNTASLRGYFNLMPLVFILLIPALTMRIWAEEKKLKTDEILLTLPIKDWHLVLGKYFSVLLLLAVMLLLTVPIPLILSLLGDFETGGIIGEYLGALLLGSVGIAIGLFISSISKNQISAFIFSVLILLFLTLVRQATVVLSLPKWLSGTINYISLDFHFDSFKKGLIDTRDLGYFILLTFMFLFLNVRVLIFKRWK